MLVTRDLGFSSLVLVLSLIFPVIGFVIRRKWKLAVARKEEIKRLLLLASEEAARAELEATLSYGVGAVSTEIPSITGIDKVVPQPQYYQCAVCFSPTTTRCARCKAVRYCSGKCQIIHWRQGHKEECYPPSITDGRNDEGINSCQKGVEQKESEVFGERFQFEGSHAGKPFKISSPASALPNTASFPEVPHVEDDEVRVEFHSDGERINSTSESSHTSFSGFSASHTTSESSDDVSVCESISSSESDKLDGPLSADVSLDMLETASCIKKSDQMKPLSPKFASLVDSVDNFTKANKLNQIKHGCNGEDHCTATSTSGRLGATRLFEGSSAESRTMSSGFWGRTIESESEACDESSRYNANGARDSKLSGSGSSLRFAFNLSPSPPLSAKCSEAKDIVSNEILPAVSGNNRPTGKVALSGNINVDTPEVTKSPSSSLNCELSTHSANANTSGSHKLNSREIRSSESIPSYVPSPSRVKRDPLTTDVLYTSSLSSSSSEKSNHVINDHAGTSHPLKSREVEHKSSGASDAQLSNNVKMHSVPSVRFSRIDNFQETSAMSPRVVVNTSNGKSGLKTSLLKAVDQFRGTKLSKQYPSGVGSETAGRYDDKGLFSYELFVKLYNWNKVELQPCGLINCGNSCYANAVLQCLAFTPPLTAYFLQGLHSKECLKKDWCFTCEFENLILKAKEGKSPLSPIRILSHLQNIGSQLGNGREEDAHEFLRYAIDTMQSVCLKEAGLSAMGSLEEETTVIGLTFGGYLRSKIKCMKCLGKSERQEKIMDLTVEIEGDIGSLEEALRRFTGTEILDGENKYKCGRCKSYEKAKKKLTILEAPNVLTIALKRFQSGKFGKLNKSIRFPEILDLAPYMSGTSDKLPIYRLYGVVVHLDIMNAAFSGHYVCYVKSTQNKWFKIDDSTVKAVELETVLSKGAYMLLYARCSPRAPRSIRNKIISHDPKNKAIPSWATGKSSNTPQLRSPSTHSSVGQVHHSSVSPDGSASIETFYSRFQRLQRILEDDSLSDASSLISSNSDEGSCSTDSTRDSSTTDDFSDFIFGDSPWRNSSDSDASSSSSSSPLYTRHSPLANSRQHQHASRPDYVETGDGPWDRLDSRNSRQCRKLDSNSCSRETDSERLGRVSGFNNVKSGVTFRESTRKNTD